MGPCLTSPNKRIVFLNPNQYGAENPNIVELQYTTSTVQMINEKFKDFPEWEGK